MKTHSISTHCDYSLEVVTKVISDELRLVRLIRTIGNTVIPIELYLTPTELRLLSIALHPENT